MIDPLNRWSAYGEKPDYAGLLTFGGMPYTEDVAELAGADVVIVGAPTDDLVSDRPGTRFAPRAVRAASCPPGPHLEAHANGLSELTVIDYGDAPVIPADPVRSHSAIHQTVGEVVAAEAIPVIIGGDHSIAEPNIRACAQKHGPVGVIHFDAHADTAPQVFGVKHSHGTPMYRLVEDGKIDSQRYIQVGLRGYWPGPEVFEWQRQQGIDSIFAHEVRTQGIDNIIETVIASIGYGPVYLSVDIDVLDPAYAPGTGTPEPGGLTSAELLRACRILTSSVNLVGAEVVEVLPTAIGSADITALAAERAIREIITGIALATT